MLDGYDPEHRIVSVVDNNVPAEQVASCPKAFQPYYYMFSSVDGYDPRDRNRNSVLCWLTTPNGTVFVDDNHRTN